MDVLTAPSGLAKSFRIHNDKRGKTLDTREVLDRFLSSVERRAFQITKFAVGHPEEALDIVQDAMMKLVQRYSARPHTEWRALFFTILESRIMDWHRRQKVRNRWRRFLDKVGLGEPGATKADEDSRDAAGIDYFPDVNATQPWQALQNERSMAILNTALERLPLRQQQAFLLRAWEGLNVTETARAMGCSVGSVKTHYSRATHALRDVLKEYAP
jgi:RNA polymerase sigma-70 factor, ECF subfamily